MARARAGEIFFSSTVYDALPLELRGQAQAIGRMALRNRPSEVLVYKHAPDAHLATIKTDPREPLATATMEVRYGAQLLVVGEDRVRVGIGRDEDADIRIDDDAVSRRHAEIAQDHDRFVLIDHSTNGTCVYADNGAVLRVMREEIVLTGSGRILIGQKEATQPIVYRVVPVGSG
ncbi:MAG: FHA domain-containing protein [Candidatus Binatia bacterium]